MPTLSNAISQRYCAMRWVCRTGPLSECPFILLCDQGSSTGKLAQLADHAHTDTGGGQPSTREAEPRRRATLNKLRTTPTPNKNGSYGIKGGVRWPYFWGSVCHISCRNPLILTDFYAIRTPLYGIFGGHICYRYGGGGGQNCFQTLSRNENVRGICMAAAIWQQANSAKTCENRQPKEPETGSPRNRGFQREVFARGERGNLNNWGRARTRCNN